MARGHPDYAKAVGTTEYGEFLQARGLPPVWWEDRFETAICKWIPLTGTATVYTFVMLDGGATWPYSDSGFMGIEPALTGVDGVTVDIGTFPETANVGFAVNFNMSSGLNYNNQNDSLRLFDVVWHDGTYRSRVLVTYNPRTGHWFVSEDYGVNYIDLGDYEVLDTTWQYAKLIIDPVNHKYIKLLINSIIIDLSMYVYDRVVIAGTIYCGLIITYTNQAPFTDDLAIDNYVVTHGES